MTLRRSTTATPPPSISSAGNDFLTLDFSTPTSSHVRPNQFLHGAAAATACSPPRYSATNVDYTFGHIAGFPNADPNWAPSASDGAVHLRTSPRTGSRLLAAANRIHVRRDPRTRSSRSGTTRGRRPTSRAEQHAGADVESRPDCDAASHGAATTPLTSSRGRPAARRTGVTSTPAQRYVTWNAPGLGGSPAPDRHGGGRPGRVS